MLTLKQLLLSASYCNVVSASVFNPVQMDFHWLKGSPANLDTMKKVGHAHALPSAFHTPQVVLLATSRPGSGAFSSGDGRGASAALGALCEWRKADTHLQYQLYLLFYWTCYESGVNSVSQCKSFREGKSVRERTEWGAKPQRASLARLQRFTAEILNPLTWFPSSY